MSTQALMTAIEIGLAFALGFLVGRARQAKGEPFCQECERRFQARLDDAGRSEHW